jgi:rhodanese-related sulfurtransferase
MNTVQLAVIEAGRGFGEEALIAGDPRNATVSMLSDGELVRLAKQDFVELMEEPLLDRVSPKEASRKAKQGAGLVDVRLETEYECGTLKGAMNIPLYLLRLKMGSLSSQRDYVVFCDTGARSAAAAFIMKSNGFEVSVLQGGLARYQAQAGSQMPGKGAT